MARQKAKIREKLVTALRRIWIVSYNGQSQVYYTKKEALEAKKAIEKYSEE